MMILHEGELIARFLKGRCKWDSSIGRKGLSHIQAGEPHNFRKQG
jgi:hypothetical protein